MTNYLCSVSVKLPENYEIGLQSRTWGVEEKYFSRIAPVRSGDLLVFVVGGAFRSIHTIETGVFNDNSPLWPPRNGSLFPHRIKISEPIAKGEVPLRDIADEISFMRDKVYSGTIQGASGVFNNRLTEEDVRTIRNRMKESKPVSALPKSVKPRDTSSSERQVALFKFYERDVEDHIASLLPFLGLEIYRDPNGQSGRQYPTSVGRMDLLCEDINGGFVVMELKKGEAPEQTLLQVLRYMSWVRQNKANGKEVSGIILTEAADKSLIEVVKEVQNVEIRYYKVAIDLV